MAYSQTSESFFFLKQFSLQFTTIEDEEEKSICPILTLFRGKICFFKKYDQFYLKYIAIFSISTFFFTYFFSVDQKQHPKWQEEGFLSTQGVPLIRLSIGEFVGLARLKVFAFLAFISGTLMHRLTGVKPDARGELPEDPWQKDLAVQSLKEYQF